MAVEETTRMTSRRADAEAWPDMEAMLDAGKMASYGGAICKGRSDVTWEPGS